ncbi:MAG: ATP-dependent zinc metalloprotease FtsH [Desulfobacterales bacterium]|jgi:cell division protease FtsH
MVQRSKFSIGYYLMVFLLMLFLETMFFSGSAGKEIPYSKFRDLIAKNKVQSVILESDKIYGFLKPKQAPSKVASQTPNPTSKAKAEKSSSSTKPAFAPQQKQTPWYLNLEKKLAKSETARSEQIKRQFTVVPLKDPTLLEDLQQHGITYRGKIESHFFSHLISNWIIPFAILFLVWGWIMRKMGKDGHGFLNVGKNKAKIYEVDPSLKVTFDDVAGVDEAVEEVKEVVSFLKEPDKYTRLGAKLPKGIMLVGPPGTGKTLLARAVAGEANVHFFSLSGSDFVEMFVGVGAARVRDLFKEAKIKAPCIIFIDELDAVGKSRAQGPYMGRNDERENTLNQLLSEMDGFDPQIGIIIMGATNRPEVLDPALLRPGRFDRQILVDRPDLIGRVRIFEVHTRNLTLKNDVDLHKLAAETPGFGGAEIANVCNEAALLASRKDQKEISQQHFQDAIERVIAGLEKKNKLINPHEREVVAYHESGHAIVGHFTPGADPIQKVSIVPRGLGALGYTLQTPLEDRFLMSRSELLGKIKGLLGGRAAEEIVFGEVSTGASNDLEKIAKIVRNMITVYGMSKQAPNISLVDHQQNLFLGQEQGIMEHSEKLEQMIDDETQQIIQTCYADAKQLLTDKRDKLERMAHVLLEKENMEERDITAILGPRVS